MIRDESINYFGNIWIIICAVFLVLHLICTIRSRNHLQKYKPYPWVKEALDETKIYIIMDTISIVLFFVIFYLKNMVGG